MGNINYNTPIEQLDKLVQLIHEQGMTPMLTPEIKAEVELRYQELIHMVNGDEDDEEYVSAREQHEAAMAKIEEQRRKSHSRNVLILDLTEQEKAEIEESISFSYIRKDPNSDYNLSDSELSADAEKLALIKRLRAIGKAYYHQEDYRNAILTIMEAIDYSLKHDYPWLSYEEALKQFEEGRIKFNFIQWPVLYIDYNTQITDPSTLKGITTGEITLVDKDSEPIKKKKKGKSNPVDMPYTVIGQQEHAEMVKVHQAGYDTLISPILKSSSTIYNRYVIPSSLTSFGSNKTEEVKEFDWLSPGAGSRYYDLVHGVKKNPRAEIIRLLNEANAHNLNQNIGDGLRDFANSWNYGSMEQKTFKSISNSLDRQQQAIDIEHRLLDIIRKSNT